MALQWESENATGAGELPQRPLLRALFRGLRCNCPSCGCGAIFARGLATEPECRNCGEPFHHHRADDLPPYLNILFSGHVVVGLMLGLTTLDLFPLWLLTAATVIAAVATAFALMRPLKGAVVAAQWALRMHGFGGDES
jgi:uncharacterized protein (DUF983 family)